MKQYYIFFAILSVLIVAVVAGQTILGMGYTSDQNKSQDMQALATDIQTYATSNSHLPAELSEVTISPKLTEPLADYSYQIQSYNQYKLCANFVHSQASTTGGQSPYDLTTNITEPDTTAHKAGNTCFTFTVADVVANPGPHLFVQAGVNTSVCTPGPRDQKWTLTDVTVDSLNEEAMTIAVSNATSSQTFTWCGRTPTVTNVKGQSTALSAITQGMHVTVGVVAPGIANASGGTMYATPYVTTIQQLD